MAVQKRGFTLIELMVVILIVGILAAASIPLLRGHTDSAKWSEANATAGTIRHAVRVYFAEASDNVTIIGDLSDSGIRNKLGFTTEDLAGTYFTASDYEVSAVNGEGVATIVVTGSQMNAPNGTHTLALDGSWR